MFADARLAARIDRAEARLSATVASHVDAAAGALVKPIAGGLAVLTWPGSPLNKLIGVGYEGRFVDGDLTAVEHSWRDRGEAVRIELLTLAPPEVATQLSERGYRLLGFENVLGLPVGLLAQRLPVSAVEVTPVVGSDDDDAWLATAIAGFGTPDETGGAEVPKDALQKIFDEFVRTPGFLRYTARIDGQVAGVASLRLDDRIAQLCGAATHPAFRRRGVQNALMVARLAVARAAGCDVAVITTSPGTRSQSNSHKQGFALLYVRAILVK